MKDIPNLFGSLVFNDSCDERQDYQKKLTKHLQNTIQAVNHST